MALIIVAALLRFAGRDWVAGDFAKFIRPWSQYIATHGYFASMGDDFANYNVPYLYLLSVLTWLHAHTSISLLHLVKGLSVVFDALLAWYAARLVGLRWSDRRIVALAGVLVLLLPTVVLNSAYWAQCDSIYTTFTMAGLYYLLRERPWVSMALFGLAITVKLQAIFVFPVLFVLLLAGRIKLRHLAPIPAVYVALAIPAWVAGRPLRDLMLIYANQSDQYTSLSMNAPTIYTFIRPRTEVIADFRTAGVLFTAAAVLVLAYLVRVRRIPLDRERIVLLATAYSILVPFLLPGMHERYFMQAEVLAVVAALYLPRRLWPVPALVQIASLMSYLPYFLGAKRPQPMDFRLLAVLMVAALLLTGWQLLRPPPAPEVERAERDETAFLVPNQVGNTIAV
ncbi:glycosyltransferase 87 family protein [Actinoplanes oblitus]|uniref:Glycosyltransferase 87 family protein n=1 Tax=Actinoplanes oblitus TaxID=3040509 RepID=A0ABY8WEP9_9ACTN|nr:glycosyltransferase 87 family protein [Actinoplanes oblitus]WIM95375.1 glycosyltransferase 87 family protein [Actinoplanes oblitus]